MKRNDAAAAMNPTGQPAPSTGACAVCGMHDARALVTVKLESGEAAILCGSHALMYERSNAACRTAAELRVAFADRRSIDRRATREVDELAARLAAAFVRERRSADRRAS